MSNAETDRTGDDPDVGGIDEGPGDAGQEGHKAPAGSSGDSGGKAHTAPGEPHPDLEGERSARDVGGPTAADDAEPQEGTEHGGTGDIQTKGFDSHK